MPSDNINTNINITLIIPIYETVTLSRANYFMLLGVSCPFTPFLELFYFFFVSYLNSKDLSELRWFVFSNHQRQKVTKMQSPSGWQVVALEQNCAGSFPAPSGLALCETWEKTCPVWAAVLQEPTGVNALMLPWLYSPGDSGEIYKAGFLLQFIINSLKRKNSEAVKVLIAQCFLLDPLCWFSWGYWCVGWQGLFIVQARGVCVLFRLGCWWFKGGWLVLCWVKQSIPGQDCQPAKVKFWFTNSFCAADNASNSR